jgi:hypothetical protein
VHDVVPVIAEPGQALHRLPCLGRVVGQQLVGHYLMHGHMQPLADGLAVENHVVITLQRVCELRVPRLDQQRALILAARVQQFEVESLVGPVCRGKRPGPPVAGLRLAEPAVPDNSFLHQAVGDEGVSRLPERPGVGVPGQLSRVLRAAKQLGHPVTDPGGFGGGQPGDAWVALCLSPDHQSEAAGPVGEVVDTHDQA